MRHFTLFSPLLGKEASVYTNRPDIVTLAEMPGTSPGMTNFY
jgi:hypothetical protein